MLSLIILFSSCNVVKVIGGGTTNVPDDFFSGANLYINVTYNTPKRDFYTYSDVAARTLQFDYPWDANVSCSADAGATWNDCSGNSYVWDYVNYNVDHHFKVYRGSEEYTYTFNPSTAMPGLSFAPCT